MKKINSFLEYFFILITVLQANSVYMHIYQSGFEKISAGLALFSLFFLLLINGKLKIRRNNFSDFVVILMVIVFEVLINYYYGRLHVWTLCLPMLPLLILYFNNDLNNIYSMLKKFVNIVIALCIVSLFFWLLGSFLNYIKPTNVVKVEWATNYPLDVNSYFNIHFNTQKNEMFNMNYWRNSSIYVEAPMFNLVISVAMMFEFLFLKSKHSFYKLILLGITLLTTFSITGIIFLFILFGLDFILKKSKNQQVFATKIILVPIIILISVTTISVILVNKQETTSYNKRMSDYTNGINAFLNKPIIGYGIGHGKIQEFGNFGFSNSLTKVLTDGGIILFLLYLLALIKGFNYCVNNKNKHYLLFIIIYLYLFVSTVFPYNMLMMIILAILYSVGASDKKNNLSLGIESQKLL